MPGRLVQLAAISRSDCD